MIPYFARLGNMLAARWQAVGFDDDAFPALGTDALSEDRPCDNLSHHDILKWILTAQELPYQPNLNATFGQPPITVFCHPKFYIEALYWTSGTTAIHEHAFSGAFTLLEGSSLQSTFTFTPSRVNDEEIVVGELKLTDVALLRPGDVQPILSGPGLIHSVFHLDTPSVSVVVRTMRDIKAQAQYTYHRPSVAMREAPQLLLRKRLQVLELLHRLGESQHDAIAEMLLAQSDLATAYHLLKYLYETIADQSVFDKLAGAARDRHGTCIDAFIAAISESHRDRLLVAMRQKVVNPEHRFFIALLLNLPSRSAIVDIVRKRFPDDDPREKLVKWACDLAALNIVDIEFDELNRTIFKYLLSGTAPDEILDRLRIDYAADDLDQQAEDLLAHCRLMQSSMVFRPLFSP